jgi:integrase
LTVLQDVIAVGHKVETVRHIYATLRVVFNDAITDRQIVDNPASGVAPPPREKVESKFLTKEQTRILVDAARDNRYYVAVRLLAETGLRRGDALALRWENIDLQKQTLWVRGTLARSDRGLYLSSPKTKTSIRQLHLPQHPALSSNRLQESWASRCEPPYPSTLGRHNDAGGRNPYPHRQSTTWSFEHQRHRRCLRSRVR